MSDEPLTRTGSGNDEISLKELLDVVTSNFVLFVCIVSIGLIATFTYVILQPEIYRSEVLLAPTESRQSTSPLLSQFAPAANIVGINLQDEPNARVDSALAMMRSRNFLQQFVERHDLVVPLMAMRWSDSDQASVVNTSLYDPELGEWVDDRPTPNDLFDTLSSAISISRSVDSSLITISLEWDDPLFAQQWLTWIVEDVNLLFKQQDLQEASSAIDYLQGQLEQTMLVDLQRVFYDLIETQTRIVMLADVREEYVFRILDPPFLPELPIRPQKLQTMLFGAVFSVLLALLVAWSRFYYKRYPVNP